MRAIVYGLSCFLLAFNAVRANEWESAWPAYKADQYEVAFAQATPLVAVLDDLPEADHHRVKATFLYQAAIMAGCTDLDRPAARAMARLSNAEAAQFGGQLDLWLPKLAPNINERNRAAGSCLS